ncbi:MAG: kelch repeat-containing protein [Armatimonadota bacterium]|nr:kelch repeat-containing protein [Armatimonadota bacterium]
MADSRTMVRAIGVALAILLILQAAAPMTLAQSPELSGLPEVNGWRLAAAMLVPRSEHAVAALDGKVYAIGGYPPGRIPSEVVQVYDVAANRWQYGPPLPVPMHHTVAAAANNRLYVIGGEFDGAGTGRVEVFLDTVYELDPPMGTWRRRASMPTARSGGAAAVVDGRIYVAGGRPPRGHDFAVYDPAADRWTVLPNLPTQRNHLAVAALDGKVYVAGGRFGGGFNSEKTGALEIYDPSTNRWSVGAPMPAPRGGVAGVAASGCLYVIGGEGNTADPRGLFDQNEAYDPRANTWVRFAPMPTPTHGLVGGAFVGGRIYLPGGAVTQGGGSGSVIHWVFRPPADCRSGT